MPLEKAKREAASQRRKPKLSGKTAHFPRSGRPYGGKRQAFQTEKALKGWLGRCASRGGRLRLTDVLSRGTQAHPVHAGEADAVVSRNVGRSIPLTKPLQNGLSVCFGQLRRAAHVLALPL